MKWWFMLVYGSADHSRSGDFLDELEREVETYLLPIMIGVTST
jgi:hypothetical protein